MTNTELRNIDEHWMREALAWSRRGCGWTSPRPSVGCVIVRDGKVIGGGHTQPGHGNPHAEVTALRAAVAAGIDPRGATAYVTLEPCSHFATTPPCTRALIAAGIARVVAGVLDPNPEVNGRGYSQLRAAGVEVESGVLVAECAQAQEEFLMHITEGRPFVTLKSAMTLDGRIATRAGQSYWITGEAARRHGHELRHRHDAILVGIGTVLADDPLLSVRLEGQWKQPLRIVMDSRGRIPIKSRLVQTARDQRLLVATTDAMPSRHEEELKACGAQVWRLNTSLGAVDWSDLLARLYAREICSVLVEGRNQVASAALAAGIVHKVAFFIAPMLLGDGISAVADFGIRRLEDAPRLRATKVEQFGGDVLVSGYLRDVPGWKFE